MIEFDSLISHPPVIIISDDNFTDYGFMGNGSGNNPYRIENLNITTTEQFGICIDNVTKTFVIKNCYVDAQDYGILIGYVHNENIIVDNNVCTKNSLHGILSYRCQGIVINNNTVKANQEGIACLRSNITISNNYCEQNTQGIWLYEDNSTVIGNECRFNVQNGIYVDNSFYAKIINNICHEHSENGIFVSSSEFITLEDNKCYQNDNGISVTSSTNCSIINNFCSVMHFDGHGFGINVDESEYIFIHGNKITDNPDNTGMTIWLSPYTTISNNTIINTRGLSVTASSHNTTIKFNMCVDGMIGAYIAYTNSCKIIYNLFQDNSVYGIELDNVYFSEVHHNTIINNVNQAIDDNGANNTWYDKETLEGNYWSDWSGSGVYSISGTSNSVDLYPLGWITITEFHHTLPFTILLLLLIGLCIPQIIRRNRVK